MPYKEHGNILFLILIAVALFAALSYAITGTSRSNSSALSEEQTEIAVSRILNYVGQAQNAVNRLLLINKCGESEISFENPDYPAPTANPRAPSDNSCHIHHPAGGGLPYLEIDKDWLLDISQYPSNSFAHLHGHYGYFGTRNIENSGTIASEMVIVIPFLKDEICTELNRKHGLSGSISIGYWMSHYLGPHDFRNNDTTNQKPYPIVCLNGSTGNSRTINSFMYVLKDR
jgi:hypothetical protein